MLPRALFEDLVAEALASLPPLFQEKMSNVEILIEMWPSPGDLKRSGVPPGNTLLGLYTGIPLTRRSHSYNLVPPDTITLFQGPIEARSRGVLEAVRQTVRHTIIHEVAHHFGIDDDRLRELGAY
jgi:predicted Zn-dependent protease with MMP-like domain